MFWEPIENRYKARMFHSGAFAIAAGVVGVGAAATSGIMGAVAADRAAKASAAATRKYQKGQRSIAEQVAGVDTNIIAPELNPAEAAKLSRELTGVNIRGLEQVLPGARKTRIAGQAALNEQQKTLLAQQGILDQYVQGKLPKELADEITRNVAERYGAGFAPGLTGAAGQQAAFQGARGLGIGALGLQQYGLEATRGVTSQLAGIANAQQNWSALAGQFVVGGRDALATQLAFGEAGMRAQQATAQLKYQGIGLQAGVQQNILQSSLNQAATDLAARQTNARTVEGIGSAVQGGLSGVSSAFGQRDAAKLYDARTQAMGGPSIYQTS